MITNYEIKDQGNRPEIWELIGLCKYAFPFSGVKGTKVRCSFKELCALCVRGNEAKLFKNTLLQSIDFVVLGQKGGLFASEFKEI